MRRAVPIEKSGAVDHIPRDPSLPWKRCAEAGAERIALVVVEKEKPIRRRTEIRDPAGHRTRSLSGLMRVSQVDIYLLEQMRRTHRDLGSGNPCAFDRKRKEQAGVANRLVIKKVMR